MDSHAAAAPPDRAILWVPRLLALTVSLFAGVFSLDAFGNGTPFLQALPDFLIHLVPAAIVVAVVALAWHREWIGAVIFTILTTWHTGRWLVADRIGRGRQTLAEFVAEVRSVQPLRAPGEAIYLFSSSGLTLPYTHQALARRSNGSPICGIESRSHLI